jgi:hypothetical protein
MPAKGTKMTKQHLENAHKSWNLNTKILETVKEIWEARYFHKNRRLYKEGAEKLMELAQKRWGKSTEK